MNESTVTVIEHYYKLFNGTVIMFRYIERKDGTRTYLEQPQVVPIVLIEPLPSSWDKS